MIDYDNRFAPVKLTFTSWLTVRRITAHAALLAVSLWAVYAYNMATPGLFDRNRLIKGADFLHFYELGSIASQHRADLLYDMPGQSRFLFELLPQAQNYVYVPLYGPQVSVFFLPLAQLSYLHALTVWLLLNLALYSICCFLIWRSASGLQTYGWTVALAAVAFPGFFHLIVWGQNSVLALLCFALAYLALRNDRDFLAGLAIGSLVFKPQLGIAAALLFLVTRRWKLVVGAVLAAILQLSVGLLFYGPDVMQSYWHTLRSIPSILVAFEPRPYQTHSLRTFFSMMFPHSVLAAALYAISTAVVLYLLARCWQRQAKLDIAYSVLLLATVLVSPHLTVYDLVILAPAFLLLGNAVINQNSAPARAVQYLLYALFPLFLVGPVARVIHVQLSVVAMAALFWICSNSFRDRVAQA